MPKNDSAGGSAPLKGDADTQTCGLVMPISAFGGYDTQHWIDVRKVFDRAILQSGMTPQPVWESAETDIIQGRIIRNLYSNAMVVCDVSGLNPNVMFELGVRLTFKKPVVIVADDTTRLPFDTNVIEHMIYPPNLYFHKIETLIDDIANRIRRVMDSVSSGEYQPYLDTFGAFTVIEPNTKKVELDDYIVGRLDDLSNSIARLEHRTAPPKYHLGIPDAAVSDRWTDERLGRLRELWAEGMTASQIADELGGVSRNAVIGKAHRLGLQSQPSPVPPPKS